MGVQKRHYFSLAFILLLVSFVVVQHASVASSHRQSRIVLPLKPGNPASDFLPVPYPDVVAGEFLDVDLPDELKAEKYGEPVEVTSQYAVQLAIYTDLKQAERAQQLLSQQDEEVSLVVVSDRRGNLSYQLHLGHYRKQAQAHVALLDIRKMFPDALRIIKY